jgi:serine/threonine protein kinase/tetratricopeptide (TPR) repeat protein
MPHNFRVLEHLGEGGMGVVWRAIHEPSGTQVAVKVLHDNYSEVSRRAFGREIHAVAALNHRGIVHIVDVGEVPDGDPTLSPGAPWFAMQLADAGTLEGVIFESFPQLARILFDILDALAYAHARGIVHRDLKPSNVLLNHTPAGLQPVLTDFGIAHVTDQQDPDLRVTSSAGTPIYMSPEQFHGDWRVTGPWTDLYALGCMIYEMVCGQPPFKGLSMLDFAMQHTQEALPKLVPLFEVPPRFEAWLRRLTQKNAELRYRSAAQASWALFRMIGDSPEWMPAATLSANIGYRQPLPTLTFDAEHTAGIDVSLLRTMLAQDSNDYTALELERPPIPFHVVEATETRSQHLFGVGLNLFGLRQTPFVGRVEEREILWGSLKRTAEGHPEHVVIEGEPGTGRTRLLDWFATRVLELGVARVLHVRHSETGSGAHGLIPALTSFLGAQMLEGRDLLQRIEHVLRGIAQRTSNPIKNSEIEDRALEIAQLLSPRPIDGYPRIAFESARERYVVMGWLLAYLCEDGPLIFAIDDVQWGWESLAFREFLQKEHAGAPIMSVMIRSVVVQCAVARGLLQNLDTLADVRRLVIGPLSLAEHEEFIRAVAPLERRTVVRIARSSGGNPARAIQLIDRLIHDLALVPSDQGYRLADNADVSQEVSLTWLRMLSSIIQHYPEHQHPDVFLALEAAAVLGQDVEFREWMSLLWTLGVSIDLEGLVDLCESIGLVVWDGQRWRFRDRQHVIELRDQCRDGDNWVRLHVACAELVDSASNGMPASERKFILMAQAGLDEHAVRWLAAAVEDHLKQSTYVRAAVLADELERRLAGLGVSPDDPRRVRVVTARFEMLRYTGRAADVVATRDTFERHVSTCPDPLARADAYRALAGALYVTGDSDEAQRYYDRAFSQAEGSPELQAKLMHGAGWVYSNGRQIDEAIQCYVRGIEYGKEAESKIETAWNQVGLAELRLRALDPSCAALAEEALANFNEVGSRTGAAMAIQVLGDYARFWGDNASAESLFKESAQMLNRVGSIVESMVLGRLAVLYFVQGREHEALQQARRAVDLYGKLVSVPVRVFSDLMVAILSEDPQARKEHWDLSVQLIDKSGFLHPDIPMLVDTYWERHRV